MKKPVLLNGDCRKYMFNGTILKNSIDLVVTSPPYDNLRTYNNSSTWNFSVLCGVISGLYNVVKDGGVVVWVVNDSTINGSETGSSFKQALLFKECGFKLHDTMIFNKLGSPPLNHNRYDPTFEYMFVFSKGVPKTFNPIKIKTKDGGKVINRNNGNAKRDKTHQLRRRKEITICKNTKMLTNVWDILTGEDTGTKHTATFPEKLAHDHIISWSNKGDIILDPFMGSGTTGRMAALLKRRFCGIEIDKEFFYESKKRIQFYTKKIKKVKVLQKSHFDI